MHRIIQCDLVDRMGNVIVVFERNENLLDVLLFSSTHIIQYIVKSCFAFTARTEYMRYPSMQTERECSVNGEDHV